MLENKIENLISISQNIGASPEYVQGGGGNTSVKINDNEMVIKASGGLLKDMTKKDGYSIVNYKSIQKYLESPSLDNDIFAQKIRSFVVATANRPSIETGFHALFGKYVIHTHSVFANLLTCSKEGEGIVKKIFPDALWIDYASPGCELTIQIQQVLKSRREKFEIVFLQNHGLIISGDTSKFVFELHSKVNEKIIKHFDLPNTFVNYNASKIDFSFIKENVLFPDQVVYTLAGEEILHTDAAKETLLAYTFILNEIENKELNPNFLTKEKIEILLGMESEKYRQKVLHK